MGIFRAMLVLAIVGGAGIAWGEEPEEEAAPAVPDPSLRAVQGQLVTVETTGGSVSGTLLGFDDDELTLQPRQGPAVNVQRASVNKLRLAPEPPRVRRVRISEAPVVRSERDGEWRVGRSMAITGSSIVTASVPGLVVGGLLLFFIPVGIPALVVGVVELIVGTALIAVGAVRWSRGDRAAPRPVAPPPPVDEPRPGEPARHFGIHFAAPAGVAIDVEAGRFYAFASFSPLFPLALRRNRPSGSAPASEFTTRR